MIEKKKQQRMRQTQIGETYIIRSKNGCFQKVSPDDWVDQESDVDASSDNEKTVENQEINQGRWSWEEHTKFLDALKKYGREWKQIQKEIGTRSRT